MKKVIIYLLAATFVLSSCTTAGAGALGGAYFGGAIGSAIGGIAGGWRGSDIGTLVGMATGAAVGAAAGAAVEHEERRAYYEDRARRSERHYDRTYASADDYRPQTVPSVVEPVGDYEAEKCITVSNARFMNSNNTTHIAKGEVVKVSFEITNDSDTPMQNVVPTVRETTGNKRLVISQPVMVESIAPHKTLRYTASISAYQSLKRGTANFELYVTCGARVISNVVDFDVDLD